MHYKKAGSLILKSLESIFVLLYIVFEELIWNVIAEPIFLYFKQLALLSKLERFFLPLNRYLLLLTFVLLLSIAEGMGVLSGVLVLRGYVKTAILLYITKIPIAVLTFWLFDLCQEKLMSFHWLKISYTFVIGLIHKFVNSTIYQTVKNSIRKARQQIKGLLQQYLHSKTFTERLKNSYRSLRQYLFSPNPND